MNSRDLRIGERRSFLVEQRRAAAADRAFAAVRAGLRKAEAVGDAASVRIEARLAEQDRRFNELLTEALAEEVLRG